MLRTTTPVLALLLAPLLGAVSLQPTAATAVGETCQGLPATAVGTAGQPVDGTDGADVIVTGEPVTADEGWRTVTVLAGAGDDRVEATTPGWGTVTALGAGADSYLGTSGADQEVRTDGYSPFTDVAVDSVRITSGVATVHSGADAMPNSDVVEIGAGTAQWTGFMTPAGSLTGGAASTLRTYARSGDASINAVRGTAVTLRSSARFSGFGRLEFATGAVKGGLHFRGTNGVEVLRVEAPESYDRIIDLRGGDDTYASDGFGSGRSRYDGGAGQDRLHLAAGRLDVDADLDDGRFVVREGKGTLRRTFEDFEDLALASKVARVDGTPAGEEIVVMACRATVSADGGPDHVHLGAVSIEGWAMPRCSSRRGSVDGGAGNDVLVGSQGRDRIVGGAGRDRADGGEGRDTCQAERTTSCEVRR